MSKISVITVCYNAASLIEKTLRSVASQDYEDFEYIVVDGASSDATLTVLAAYSRHIDLLVSEPDRGIYEAMNKAVRRASGQYCIFMNAGDEFCSCDSLKSSTPYLDGKSVIVLGNELIMSGNRIIGYTKAQGSISDETLLISSISHQASFILRSALLDNPYDEALRLVSDWKFALESIVVKRLPYKCMDVDVCRFYVGGATSLYPEKGKAERHKVLVALFGPEQAADIESRHLQVSFMDKVSYHIRLLRRRIVELFKHKR